MPRCLKPAARTDEFANDDFPSSAFAEGGPSGPPPQWRSSCFRGSVADRVAFALILGSGAGRGAHDRTGTGWRHLGACMIGIVPAPLRWPWAVPVGGRRTMRTS